jgi:hypothetical protein
MLGNQCKYKCSYCNDSYHGGNHTFPSKEKIFEVFNTFDLQLSSEKKDIYGQKLNARDAWSYLIIHSANKSIQFKNTWKIKRFSVDDIKILSCKLLETKKYRNISFYSLLFDTNRLQQNSKYYSKFIKKPSKRGLYLFSV